MKEIALLPSPRTNHTRRHRTLPHRRCIPLSTLGSGQQGTPNGPRRRSATLRSRADQRRPSAKPRSRATIQERAQLSKMCTRARQNHVKIKKVLELFLRNWGGSEGKNGVGRSGWYLALKIYPKLQNGAGGRRTKRVLVHGAGRTFRKTCLGDF